MCVKINKKSIIYLAATIVLIVISGFRPIGIDRDSLNYVIAIQSFTGFFQSNFIDKEPSFWLIVYLNELLFNNYVRTVFITYALLGISLKIYAIRKLSLFPIFSILIYMSYYFVLQDMTQIRIGVASSIFLLAIPDILDRNFKKYFLKTVLASMFHYSAVIMIFFYFLNPTKLNRMFYLILPFSGMALALANRSVGIHLLGIKLIHLLPDILSYKLLVYRKVTELGMKNFSKINLLNLYEVTITFAYLFFVLNYKKFKSKYDLLFIKFLGYSIFIFYSLSFMPVLSFRISEFLGIVTIILLADLVLIFKNKIIAFEFVFIYVIIMSINEVLIHGLLNM